MTVSDLIISSLKNNHVKDIFGIISIHTLDFYDALYRSSDLYYWGGRTELASTFMADGYSRSSKNIGVVLTSTGPGAANSIHAMGEAYHSCSRILQITTNIETEFLGLRKGLLHEPIDQLKMFDSVTSKSFQIINGDDIENEINNIFHVMNISRPSSFVLEIPNNILGQEQHSFSVDIESNTKQNNLPIEEINMLVEYIKKASNPIFLLGEEVMFCKRQEIFVQLAEVFGIPVVTTAGSKGLFPENHNLSLGQILGNRIWGNNPVHEYISECDLLVAFGAGLPYQTTKAIDLNFPDITIQTTLNPLLLGRNVDIKLGIVGDADYIAMEILEIVKNTDVFKGNNIAFKVKDVKLQSKKILGKEWPTESKIFESLREVIPIDSVTVWDTTVPTSRASRCFEITKPNTFINPHGWVGIGFAFPASIGAKIANPDKPVVCFTGDGGFQYCMSELGTLLQNDIPITVVMFNDDAWGVLKNVQRDRYKNRFMGTTLANPNFVQIFNSFGFSGIRVNSLIELKNSLVHGMNSNKTNLIEVSIPNGLENF
jgi:acetolactate synthase-1/2/3 large subunit